MRPPQTSTLFPYPPLFRSRALGTAVRAVRELHRLPRRERAERRVEVDELALDARDVRQVLDRRVEAVARDAEEDRKSTRLNSSHANISYAVFCWKKKITTT